MHLAVPSVFQRSRETSETVIAQFENFAGISDGEGNGRCSTPLERTQHNCLDAVAGAT
jgi:pyrrolidone-carboxylate peptidase